MTPPKPTWPIDNSFDVAFADELARLETYNKHHYRPNTYLHKWWGRRCGTTFRLILKGLVDDPANRPYYKPEGLEGKVILDPMMGGGTTLHEAIRLGASVMGVDVDPIPVLQARATMTDHSVKSLQAAFNHLYNGLVRSVGDLFQTHCPDCDAPVPFWYTLYGLRRRCACREALFVDSLILRHEPDGRVLRWCPDCGELTDSQDHNCMTNGPNLIERGQDYCERCNQPFLDITDRPYYERYQLLAVAGRCDAHGLFHKSPDRRDDDLLAQANGLRGALSWQAEQFCVAGGDKSIQLIHRNIRNYLDLFSSRQLAFLDAALRYLPDDDPIVRLNLALLVSTSLEFNSMLCSHKGINKRRAGAVRHTFSHHGYSFPYTALENNPIFPRRASGTLQKLFQSRIVRGRRWAAAPQERVLGENTPRFVPIYGERDSGLEVEAADDLYDAGNRFFLMQGSSVALPVASGSIDAIVTDPPYYDSIQYGDLAAFFRVWLRQFLPAAADWDYDETAAAVSPERAPDNHQYYTLMEGIFREGHRVLKPETGRLIFTFHHWQPRAWAALSAALNSAGFALLNHYVVHAEHPISVHISKMRALTHDAILVLALRDPNILPRWPRPRSIDHTDSFRFTETCAGYLGWILDQPDLSRAEIEGLWAEFLSTGDDIVSAGNKVP